MGEFEEFIEGTGLVEFAGWHFEKDECDEYLHEPTQIAAQIWREKEYVIRHQQSKIEQLGRELAHLAEMNMRYLGKMQEQQDMVANLKDTMSRIADELEYPKATWDEVYLCSIKALRGECE